MVSQQPQQFKDCQRIHAVKEEQGGETVVKISLERFDAMLGWYSAGALTVPVHQLPLLQQALQEMNCPNCAECPEKCQGKIIPFPLMVQNAGAEVVEM